MTTTITGNAGGTAGFNVGIAKLGASVGASLAQANSTTSSSSVTVTQTFNNTGTTQLKFAGWQAVQKVEGEYAMYICGYASASGWMWRLQYNGNVGSYKAAINGTAKCPKSSYSTGSSEYKALNAVWGTSC